ncbi:hypothetical protein H8959_018481 [Pygathrix nigripes]
MNHELLPGLMVPPGGTKSPAHSGNFALELERRSGFCGPAQRGDVTTECRFSPPLPPPAEVAARAGRSSELLLLVLLWPPSLSGCLELLNRRGVGHSTSEADAARRRAGREGGRSRVGGRRAGRRAGA